jgi:hypothetical protein
LERRGDSTNFNTIGTIVSTTPPQFKQGSKTWLNQLDGNECQAQHYSNMQLGRSVVIGAYLAVIFLLLAAIFVRVDNTPISLGCVASMGLHQLNAKTNNTSHNTTVSQTKLQFRVFIVVHKM